MNFDLIRLVAALAVIFSRGGAGPESPRQRCDARHQAKGLYK